MPKNANAWLDLGKANVDIDNCKKKLRAKKKKKDRNKENKQTKKQM